MANTVANIAKGSVIEKVRDNPNVVALLLLKLAEADSDIVDHVSVAALLAAANSECDFTNYARKLALTASIVTDDVNNWMQITLPDQTWASAGGAANNTIVKLVVAYQDGAGDANLIPLTFHDMSKTTVGADVVIQFPGNVVYKAA